jgi:outer membrane protein assembly factor BamB
LGRSAPFRGRRRALGVATASLLLTLVYPSVAAASWPQFQGGVRHEGGSDGPTAPLEVAWRSDDVELDAPEGVQGGLSSPVVAEDGTIVAVGPTSVLGFSSADGAERFSVDRDFGPSSQPAIAEGPDGPIVVYTEGFGDEPPGSPTPTVTTSPTPAPDEDDAAFDSHVNAVDLDGNPAWEEPAQLEAVAIVPVAVDADTAYVADIDGGVTALDVATGEERWTVDVGSPVAGAVTVADGRAYVAAYGPETEPGTVVALDPATGEELWSTDEETISSKLVSAVIATDDALVVLEAASVVSLDPADGRLRWRTEIVNPLRNPPFFFSETATPAPVVAGDLIVAMDVSGRVYGLDAETGALRWDQALNDASLQALPVATGEHVLVPTDSGTLTAVDLATGHVAWRVDAGASLLRGLADAGEVLVGVTGFDEAGVVAFARGQGTLLDEASPTTFDAGRFVVGLVLGGLLLAIGALLVARPLQRRLGPALAPLVDDEGGEA